MGELFAIIANLAWGVVTIAAFARGVEKIRSADLTGLGAAGSILLLILVLLSVNGVALYFVMIFGYGEGRTNAGFPIRELLLFFVLLLPSAVVWFVLGGSADATAKRRWERR